MKTETITFDVSSESQLQRVANKIIKWAERKEPFLLWGGLGAGKTTLVKAVGKHLGVVSEISSPTFSIVNEYTLPDNARMLHFDLYRMKNKDELLEIGFNEYIESKDITFIEWPDLAKPYLNKYVTIEIQVEIDTNKRTITLKRNATG